MIDVFHQHPIIIPSGTVVWANENIEDASREGYSSTFPKQHAGYNDTYCTSDLLHHATGNLYTEFGCCVITCAFQRILIAFAIWSEKENTFIPLTYPIATVCICVLFVFCWLWRQPLRYGAWCQAVVWGLAGGGCELKGFQKNKNKIKTSLWQGFKGSHHIQEQLFKKTQSLPILFWAKPVVQKPSDGWLRGHCSKNALRSEGCLLSQITLQAAPSKRQEAFSPLRKLFSSGEAATAARPSAVTGWGRQRRHLPSETAGRAEHWNVINCSDWNFARTPRLTTYTYRGEKKSFNELRKKRSKNYIKTDSTTYPAVAYFSREWLDGRREGKRWGVLEFWLSTVWIKSWRWLCPISKNLPPPRMIIRKRSGLNLLSISS